MNVTTRSVSAVWNRRIAKAALRRPAALSVRQISSSAPVLGEKKHKKIKPKSQIGNHYAETSLASLLARLSLPPSPELQSALLACLTHPSYARHIAAEAASAKDKPAEGEQPTTTPIPDNELLASLGNTLLGLFASEEVAARYPHLPSTALKQAVTAHVGPAACVSVGRELGLGVTHDAGKEKAHANAVIGTPIRWHRNAPEKTPEIETPVAPGFRERQLEFRRNRTESWEEGVASVVRAFVGLIFQEQGMAAARKFVHAHFMSRHVDMASIFTFRQPKYVLSNVVSKHLADAGVPHGPQTGRIESRVLASSGVHTQAPVFNIGLFLTNGLKLAEGHGSSLAMAEHRAATNALLSLFLVRSDSTEGLPTSAHDAVSQFKGGVISAGESEALAGLGKNVGRRQ